MGATNTRGSRSQNPKSNSSPGSSNPNDNTSTSTTLTPESNSKKQVVTDTPATFTTLTTVEPAAMSKKEMRQAKRQANREARNQKRRELADIRSLRVLNIIQNPLGIVASVFGGPFGMGMADAAINGGLRLDAREVRQNYRDQIRQNKSDFSTSAGATARLAADKADKELPAAQPAAGAASSASNSSAAENTPVVNDSAGNNTLVSDQQGETETEEPTLLGFTTPSRIGRTSFTVRQDIDPETLTEDGKKAYEQHKKDQAALYEKYGLTSTDNGETYTAANGYQTVMDKVYGSEGIVETNKKLHKLYKKDLKAKKVPIGLRTKLISEDRKRMREKNKTAKEDAAYLTRMTRQSVYLQFGGSINYSEFFKKGGIMKHQDPAKPITPADPDNNTADTTANMNQQITTGPSLPTTGPAQLPTGTTNADVRMQRAQNRQARFEQRQQMRADARQLRMDQRQLMRLARMLNRQNMQQQRMDMRQQRMQQRMDMRQQRQDARIQNRLNFTSALSSIGNSFGGFLNNLSGFMNNFMGGNNQLATTGPGTQTPTTDQGTPAATPAAPAQTPAAPAQKPALGAGLFRNGGRVNYSNFFVK